MNKMTNRTAKIFIADERGADESARVQIIRTFNGGSFFNQNKMPFFDLHQLNTYTVAGSASAEIVAEHDAYHLLLPITGQMIVNDISHKTKGKTFSADVEEVLICAMPANSRLEIRNPYAHDFIQFLQISISAAVQPGAVPVWRTAFNITKRQNQLTDITLGLSTRPGFAALPFSVYMAQFEGRQEAVYKTTGSSSALFAFVLTGAFELNGRLLHEQDGLALTGEEQIEMEALSNGAVIILIELTEHNAA